jgi:cobalt-zinc-cadmium efflux system outer membrane protein
MHVGKIVGALTVVSAVALRAQQPVPRSRADSAARTDSSVADSARITNEMNRIRSEPRQALPAILTDTGPTLVLTRQQAIDSVLAHNPTLIAAREQTEQARARVTEAVAIPDPSLSATIVGQSGALTPSSANEHDYALNLTVPFPDRIRLRGKVAGADVQTARLSYLQLRQQLASQTSQTYDSLLVALRHLGDFQQTKQLSQDFLTRTQARFEGGTSPKLDVIKAKVDVAQAENELISGRRDVANARASLNRLMGRLLGANIAPADSLEIPPALPELATLEKRAAELRPEIRSLAAQRSGASAATTLAKEFWLPDISLGLTRLNVVGTTATYDTGIGIGFPLFFWQHTGGEVSESEHHERELAATNRDLVAQVNQEVRVAYAGAATALQQAQYLHDELVPESQQAYTIASTSYGLGGSSALEVLDAKRTLLDAQTQYTAALGAVNDAIAQLELAVGAPLASVPSGVPHD